MALLYAAAIGGYTITDVYRWVQLHGHEDAAAGPGQPAREHELLLAVRPADVRGEQDRRRRSGRPSSLSLSWAIIPQPGRRGHPARAAEGSTSAEFIAENGTLYLIAAGDEDSPVAPLFRRVHLLGALHEAGLIGSTAPAGRLDPPLWLGLDEVTQICPVDLPVMLADSAGKGVAHHRRGPRHQPARGPVGRARRRKPCGPAAGPR